ncbi:MAG: tetratricopeptide repeat protein [Bacteroidota bacterium]
MIKYATTLRLMAFFLLNLIQLSSFATVKTDTLKVNNWLKQAESQFRKKNFKSAFSTIDSAISLARESGFENGVRKAWNLKGDFLSRQKKYVESIHAYREVMSLSSATEDSVEVLMEVADAFKKNKDYDSSAYYFEKSEDLFRKLGDAGGIAKALNYQAILQRYNGNIENALALHSQALSVANKGKIVEEILGSHRLRAMIFRSQEQYEEALAEYLQAAKSVYLSESQNDDAYMYHLIASIYRKLEDYDNAADYYQRALTINRSLKKPVKMSSTLRGLGDVYSRQDDYINAIKYYEEALLLARQSKDSIGLASINHSLSILHGKQGAYKKALSYENNALELNELSGTTNMFLAFATHRSQLYSKIGNYDKAYQDLIKSAEISLEIDSKENTAKSWHALGNLESQKGNYAVAFSFIVKAANLYEELDILTSHANCWFDIAGIHQTRSNLKNALKNYNKALSVYKKLNSKSGIGSTWLQMATIYQNTGKYDSAFSYFEKSLMLFDSIKSKPNKRKTLLLLGNYYLEKTNLRSAEEHFIEALDLGNEMGIVSDRHMVSAYSGLAKVYITGKFYTKAIESGLDAISIASQIGAKQKLVAAHEIVSEAYAEIGAYEKAFYHQQQFAIYQDSLTNETNTRNLNEILTKYETDKKEKENLILKKEANLAELTIKKQQSVTWTIGIALIVVILFAFYVFYAYLTRKKLSIQIRQQHDALQKSHIDIQQKNVEISQQKEKAEKDSATIQQQYDEIKSIQDTRARWVANIAHELRTPLTLVLGPLQNVIRQKSPKLEHSIKASLEMANKNGNKLLGLVNEILSVSKLESGALKLQKSVFNVSDLISRITGDFTELANQKNVALYQQISQGIFVDADQLMLEKIITNLLSNALKFTDQGGKVTITMLAPSENQNSLQISVKDTGKGIPTADVGKIFDRYFQSSHHQSTLQGGTGIGLSLSRELAYLHEGDISVSSTLNKGSEFIFSMPDKLIVTGVESETAELNRINLESNPHKASRKKVDGSKPSLLIVEDNIDMRQYVRDLMEDSYQITEAVDGQEAVELLESFTPDLIISDMMMPRMDGLQFAELLKKEDRWKQIPFIALTARTDLNLRLNSLRIGIDDYISKPFHAEELQIRSYNLLYNARERKLENKLIITEKSQSDNKPLEKRQHKVENISTREERLIEDLKKEVLEKLADSLLSVSQLASFANMSESTLLRTVKKTTGFTPVQFIAEIRLQQAMEYLENQTYETVKEVAISVGMGKSGNFAAVFEKRFGKKPSELMSKNASPTVIHD